MFTIRTLEKIKTGSKLTLANGIYALAYGILYLILLGIIARMNFRAIGKAWTVFKEYNPEMASIFLRLMVAKAILIIALGIAIIYLSVHILKKKDKKAWVILFLIGLILWPPLLTLEIMDKNLYGAIISFIGWLSFIIGMLIPIKYYLEKEYPAY